MRDDPLWRALVSLGLRGKQIAWLVLALVGLAAIVAFCVDISWQSGRPEYASTQSAKPPFRAERYTITFERTGCLGYCPVFVLQVQPDLGTDLQLNQAAHFRGEELRWSELHFRSRVEREQMLQLISTIEHGQFWRLQSDYSIKATDLSSTSIEVATPERRWTVRVSGVRCMSQRAYAWSEASVEPVPDVFCALASKLDAIACQTYTQGHARKLADNEEIYFPPNCPAG